MNAGGGKYLLSCLEKIHGGIIKKHLLTENYVSLAGVV